ncbi:MAG: xanthine dehydrogenase family protein subunit M [Gammaproteobacteria bacterium]|nr:xanthine dehydrogenase family protein subunit M [Gammaproteobacteria bacterium]
MKYFEPTSIDEAVAILAREDDARCVSGGATLVAMMNADLLSPSTLVGLRRVSGIEGITKNQQGLRIGAMTTHATIAKSGLFVAGMNVINRAANQIAHPPIRNMGTIGGSISHADPAADFPTALIAANASIEVSGMDGQRLIPADEFFLGYYETAVAENEFVTAILVPKGPENAVGEHVKVTRVDGDFATVSVSLVLAFNENQCSYARIAVGAVAATPLHLDEADAVLTDSALTDEDIDNAAALLVKASDPIDDVRGSANYRRALIPRLLKRAVSLLKTDA